MACDVPNLRVRQLIAVFVLIGWFAFFDGAVAAHVIRVGPNQAANRIADAMRLAKDGDVVEVESGTYLDGVGTWSQNHLTIRALRGRARIVQVSEAAEGKAIWVIKGDDVLVENFEFAGAVVPDRNGAGIRHEGGKLTIRNCLFEKNQMGLLTWNDLRAELVIEGSEFRDNRLASSYRPGDSIGHQIYVGTISRFTLRESYVHRGAFGHLVKSRANENYIVNNRITDEVGGRSSYELEFPNGGVAYVIGNIIEQGAQSENQDLISFGAEGYLSRRNDLYLVHNTLVDDLPRGGIFVHVWGGAGRVVLVNNLMLGPRPQTLSAGWEGGGNAHAKPGDVPLARRMDYRLGANSPLVGAAIDVHQTNAENVRPEREYVHPMHSRDLPPGPRSPGALQSVVQ
jgi:hypothetical protein